MSTWSENSYDEDMSPKRRPRHAIAVTLGAGGRLHPKKYVNVSFSEPGQAMVTFIIGANKQNFVVHRHLASAYSPFFKAAFESNMLEGTTQTMVLEDVDPETFGMLVHFLYTERLDEERYCLRHSSIYNAGAGQYGPLIDFDLVQLAWLWKLAERALMPVLQNEVMAEIWSITENMEASQDRLESFVEFICANTSAGQGDSDMLRKVLLHIVACSDYRNIMQWVPECICRETAELLKCNLKNNYRSQLAYEEDFFVAVPRT